MLAVEWGQCVSYSPASHFTGQEAEPWEVKGPASHKLAVF